MKKRAWDLLGLNHLDYIVLKVVEVLLQIYKGYEDYQGYLEVRAFTYGSSFGNMEAFCFSKRENKAAISLLVLITLKTAEYQFAVFLSNFLSNVLPY